MCLCLNFKLFYCNLFQLLKMLNLLKFINFQLLIRVIVISIRSGQLIEVGGMLDIAAYARAQRSARMFIFVIVYTSSLILYGSDDVTFAQRRAVVSIYSFSEQDTHCRSRKYSFRLLSHFVS